MKRFLLLMLLALVEVAGHRGRMVADYLSTQQPEE